MKAPILLAAILFILNTQNFSQSCYNDIVKEYDLGGNVNVGGTSITNDSLIYTVGSVDKSGNGEAFVIKTNAVGDVLWTKLFTGTKSENFNAVGITADGGCIAVGSSGSYAGTTSFALFVVRLDKNGNIVWSKTFNTNSYYGDFAYGVLETSDGGFVICGNQNSGGYAASNLIIKTDNNGNALWLKRYNNIEGGEFENVVEVSDGYLVAGEYLANGNTKYRAMLLKVNKATGNFISLKSWDTSPYSTTRVHIYPRAGGFYISAGLINGVSYFSSCRLMIMTLNENLAVENVIQINHAVTKNNAISQAAVFPDGSVISGMGGNNVDADIYRINSSGAIDWKLRFGGSGTQQINACAAIGLQSAVFSGYDNNNTNKSNLLLIFATLSDIQVPDLCRLTQSDALVISPNLSEVNFSYDDISNFSPANWTPANPTTEPGNYAISFSCANANCSMPFSLKSFNGNLMNNSASHLSFTTVDESAIASFEIERSYDAIRFEKVGNVKPKKTGNVNEYSFNDYSLSKIEGQVFYRLKIIDLQGRFTYSSTILLLKNKRGEIVKILPNPAREFAQLIITSSARGSVDIQILDTQGRLISTQTAMVEAGNNAINITGIASLKKGVYFVISKNADRVTTEKLIIN